MNMTAGFYESDRNEALIRGVAVSAPEFSHSAADQAFYTFPLAAARLSGHEDLLNVIVPAAALQDLSIAAGDLIELTGSIRSRNVHEGEKYRLILTVYAETLHKPEEAAHCNTVFLEGSICKPPVYRVTPLGREVCDIMLAVRRRYGRADFLPMIAWGRNAAAAQALSVGDRLRCEGRFQSRIYTKLIDGVGVEKTAYEVSLSSLERLLPET